MKELSIPKELITMIDLKCCDARIGYGGILILGFGEKIFYNHPKLKGRFRGEWDVRTHTSSWRITSENKILAGCYDDPDLIEPLIINLLSKKLEAINWNGRDELQLNFEGDCTVIITAQSKDEYILDISCPNSIYIKLRPIDHWVVLNGESKAEVSDYDKEMMDHADECAERWRKIVNQSEDQSVCKNCFFFLRTNGDFHFLDFGLCSSSESKYDGKVVEVNSGCQCFKSASN